MGRRLVGSKRCVRDGVTLEAVEKSRSGGGGAGGLAAVGVSNKRVHDTGDKDCDYSDIGDESSSDPTDDETPEVPTYFASQRTTTTRVYGADRAEALALIHIAS